MTGSTPDVIDPHAETSSYAEDLEDIALGDDYALTANYVDMVVDAADRGDSDRLRELVHALRAEDVADLMGFLSADYREDIIPLLDAVLVHLPARTSTEQPHSLEEEDDEEGGTPVDWSPI